MKCNTCGKSRSWVGYKTGIGKSKKQLEQMHKDQTVCRFCGSQDVECGLDRESETGQQFGEMDAFAAKFICSVIDERFRKG